MAARLKTYSDGIGEDIYKTVNTVMEVADQVEDQPSDSSAKSDLTKLKEKRDQLLEKKHFVHKRLEKAYPNIKEKLSKYDKSQ